MFPKLAITFFILGIIEFVLAVMFALATPNVIGAFGCLGLGAIFWTFAGLVEAANGQ